MMRQDELDTLRLNLPECEKCTHFGWYRQGQQWRMLCYRGRPDYCVTLRSKSGSCGPEAKHFKRAQLELTLEAQAKT